MTGAYILDGDTIVLEMNSPHDGAIVVALVDGESTAETILRVAGCTLISKPRTRNMRR
jgi:SOS-response transcriptional repressor LexA